MSRFPLSKVAKWLIRGIAALSVLLFLALAAGAVYLNHWFKSGDVRGAVVYLLGVVTGGEVEVGSISVNEKGKISVHKLSVKKPGGGFQFTADTIEAMVDLDSLWMWKINLPSVNIERPRLALLPAPEPAKGATPPPAEPVARGGVNIPKVKSPIFITVNALALNDLAMERVDKSGSVSVSGVNFSGKGSIGPDGGEGSFSIVSAEDALIVNRRWGSEARIIPQIVAAASLAKSGDIAIRGDVEFISEGRRKNVSISSPVRLKASMKAEGEINGVPTGHATAFLSLDKEQLMDISASAEDDGGNFKYEIKSRKMKINLDSLSKFAAPPGIWANGVMDVTEFDAKGTAPGDGKTPPETVISGKTHARLYFASINGVTMPEGGSMDLTLDEFKISGKGYAGKVTGGLSVQKLEFEDTDLKGIFGKLEADMSGTTQTASSGVAAASLFIADSAHKETKFAGMNFTLKAKGDFLNGDIGDITATVASQDGVFGKLSGAIGNYGLESLASKVYFRAPMERLNGLLPSGGESYYFTSGQMDASAEIGGKAGMDFKEPRITFTGVVNLGGVEGEFAGQSAHMRPSSGYINFKGRLNPLLAVTDLETNANIKSAGVEAEDSFTATPVNFTMALRSPDPVNDKVWVKFLLNSDRFSTGKRGKEFPAYTQVEAISDPVLNKYVIKSALARIGSSSMRAQGWLDSKGMNFKGDLGAEDIDLKTVFRLIPAASRKDLGLQQMEGQLKFAALWEGKLPGSMEDFKWPPPFDFSGDIKLTDGAINLKPMGIIAEGASATLAAGAGRNGAKLAGTIRAKKFVDKAIFGGKAADPSAEVDLRYLDNDRLEVDKFIISAPAIGLSESFKGTIGGLSSKAWGDLAKKPGKVVPNLAMNFENHFTLAASKGVSIFKTDLEGGANMDLTVKSIAGESLSITGKAAFSDFSIWSKGKKVVEKLNGRLPFSKKLTFLSEKDGGVSFIAHADFADKAKTVRDDAFFESLRGWNPGKDSLKVEYINMDPVLMRGTAFDLKLGENSLGVDFLRTAVLGGSLTGAYQMKGEGGGPILRGAQFFSEINLERVLHKDFGLSEKEAGIDGSMEVAIAAGDEDDGLDISKADAAVYITRISPEALDKLLLFMDPKESVPSIMSVRALLKRANPGKVEFSAKHGAFSMTVGLKYGSSASGQAVSIQVMKDAPISAIANLAPLEEAMRGMTALNLIIRTVCSEALVANADGHLAFR